jgi:hypothetical protein
MTLRVLFAAMWAGLYLSAWTPSVEAQSGNRSGHQSRVTTQILPLTSDAHPLDINNRGEIVGRLGEWYESAPFIWTQKDGLTIIDDYNFGYATAISNVGVVVGVSSTSDGDEGWMWSRRDGLTRLGAFLPSAINSKGQIAGAVFPSRRRVSVVGMRVGTWFRHRVRSRVGLRYGGERPRHRLHPGSRNLQHQRSPLVPQ